MGRRDAVQVTLEVVSLMRSWEPRLNVTYEAGWERRGNGSAANYEGGIVHHTASASSLARPFPTQTLLRDGRVGLSGPLCNEAGPACTVEAPRLHVIAAHPANHAGASGGRSMGPLPVTSAFNARVRGLEIDYAGTVPMLAGQLYVASLWAKANAIVVGGGDINRIRAHMETSVTGKWDPGYANGRTIDMAQFRAEAQGLSTSTASTAKPAMEDDMPMIVTSPNGQSLLVGDRLINFASPANVRGTTGIPVMQTTADMHDRMVAVLTKEGGSVPLVVSVAGKAYFMLAGDRYQWISEMATVDALVAAGASTIQISEAEHGLWVEAFGPEGADLTLDAKAVAALPVPKLVIDEQTRLELAVSVNDEADRRARDGEPATGPAS